MSFESNSMSYLKPLKVTFDDRSPVAWPATCSLTSLGEYPFGLPQDDSIEAYVERRYLESLWMPEILEPLSALVPSLRRVVPPATWSPHTGPHPLHAVLDEHLLDLVDIHKKYRKIIPALLVKEGDAQDAQEACIWYAWTHVQPEEEEGAGGNEAGEGEDKWTKQWLNEAEKREYLVQILLRMLKLSLPPPPLPKRKRRKNKEVEEMPVNADIIASLEMLADRIGIMRQTAEAALAKDQDKNEQEASARDWAATFCEDVLRPLFEESLPEHYETIRYQCMPITSRPNSPARSEASNAEPSQSQSQPQSRSPSRQRSLARSTSTAISARAGNLYARTHSSRSISREDSLARSISGSSRSRSGSIEPSLNVDTKSRSRSRSVSFAAGRSAGGIRAPVQRPGMRPMAGPRGKTKMKQVNSALGLGLGRPSRVAAPEPPRAQATGPTTLVAETPQKPSRVIQREVSGASIPFMQKLQAGSQTQSQSHYSQGNSMAVLEEFMVASPERTRDDFMLSDMVLETPKK